MRVHLCASILFQAFPLQFGAHVCVSRDQKVLEITGLGLATFYHILSPVLVKHPLSGSGLLIWDEGVAYSPEACYLMGAFLSWFSFLLLSYFLLQSSDADY